MNATAKNFQTMLETQYRQHHNYYLHQASSIIGSNQDPAKQIWSILNDIDFIGITERMDESVVALSILWGLPLADVLYLSAKTNGGYDGGGGGCHLIPKSIRVPGMQEVIDSEFFQDIIQWDNVVFQLANRSLDLTIDQTIGRDKFNKAYSIFQNARKLAEQTCSKEVQFPCTGGGLNASNDTWGRSFNYKDTDCLMRDSGCGYMCLDDVATELGLWGPQELKYSFPGAFGLGPSSQKRLRKRLPSIRHADSQEWETGFDHLEVPKKEKNFYKKTDNRSRRNKTEFTNRGRNYTTTRGMMGMMTSMAVATNKYIGVQRFEDTEQVLLSGETGTSRLRGLRTTVAQKQAH